MLDTALLIVQMTAAHSRSAGQPTASKTALPARDLAPAPNHSDLRKEIDHWGAFHLLTSVAVVRSKLLLHGVELEARSGLIR